MTAGKGMALHARDAALTIVHNKKLFCLKTSKEENEMTLKKKKRKLLKSCLRKWKHVSMRQRYLVMMNENDQTLL